jgi:hypothetical protein
LFVGLLVAATAVWGGLLDRAGEGIALHAAPLFGAASNRLGPLVLIPLGIAALVVWRGPALSVRLDWTRVLMAAFAATVVWGIALALVDHNVVDGLTRGVRSPHDLLAGIDAIIAPGSYVRTFVDNIDGYVVHVRGHPPALGVALWWMDRIGLGGAAQMVALAIGCGGITIVSGLVACREVAGEDAARRVAPFLVLSPAAIWMVTSADAIYAGIGAAGVAALIVATGRTGVRSHALNIVGGLLLGVGVFMSYGLLALFAVPFVVAFSRRRLRTIAVAAAAVVAVGLVFAAFGFSWFAGLTATRAEYAQGVAALRPYGYFVFANIAAFAIALGPAPIAGVGRLRDRRLWLLVGTAVAVVALVDLSGLSKGEVERIWLPFWPWMALAAAALTDHVRWWLAAQVCVAVAVQTFIGTPW